MDIEIIEKNNKRVFVYKEGELLFYSIIKFNWINRILNIYNSNNELIIKLQIGGFFMESTFAILFQNDNLSHNITAISESQIYFYENRSLKKRYNNRIISFSWNYYYVFKEVKIAQVKHKIWSNSSRTFLSINEGNLIFLDQIIIHILAIKAGYDSN